MAFPFDPARLVVGAAVQRAAAHQTGAHVCKIHGPLKTAHGRKCPHCGPPWIRYVRWDPAATPQSRRATGTPALDSPPRIALDPAQMAIALAALNESDRLAHARALGCRDGQENTPAVTEEYPHRRVAWPAASIEDRGLRTELRRFLSEHRGAHGAIAGEILGRRRKRRWRARTLRSIARGDAYLFEATRNRIRAVLDEFASGVLRLECVGTLRNGQPRYVVQRHACAPFKSVGTSAVTGPAEFGRHEPSSEGG
jgi:hypothetical protein